MADTADVEEALTTLICTTLLPADYEQGLAESSLLGPPLRVFRGWPTRRQLDSDLKAGITDVSIFPRPEETNMTRYGREWQPILRHQHTISASISGSSVTFGGSVSRQNVAIIVDDHYYIYSLQENETLTDLASALATLASMDMVATSSGPTLHLPASIGRLEVRAGGFGTHVREIKRQQRTYQLTFWAATPALRDAVVRPVDELLADIQWLTLADGTTARLLYHNSLVDDGTERVGVYRRDLFYSAEFATTQSLIAPEMVITVANFSVTEGPPPPPGETPPSKVARVLLVLETE